LRNLFGLFADRPGSNSKNDDMNESNRHIFSNPEGL
jgi:hypothetical protein